MLDLVVAIGLVVARCLGAADAAHGELVFFCVLLFRVGLLGVHPLLNR